MADTNIGVTLVENGERFGRLEQRMDTVEEGVANFRNFQKVAADFFSRADERAENDEKHRNKRDQEIKDAVALRDKEIKDAVALRERIEERRWKFAGLVLGIIMAVVTILAYLEGTRRAHGDYTGAKPDTVLSSTQKPQDAKE
jgi:hypothetical protein